MTWTILVLAISLPLLEAWPLSNDFSYCWNYCSTQGTNSSACMRACQAASTYSSVRCVYMCADEYGATEDMDACAARCNATLNSQIPPAFDFSFLLLIQSFVYQTYNVVLSIPSTVSDISIVTVFTTEEEYSQPQVMQYIYSGQSVNMPKHISYDQHIHLVDDVYATNNPTFGAPPNDGYYNNCLGMHASLIMHMAIFCMFLVFVVLVINCCTAITEAFTQSNRQNLNKKLFSAPVNITPPCGGNINVSPGMSGKLLKGAVITL